MTDTGEQNTISDIEPTILSVSTEPTDSISKILKYKEEGYYFHASSNPEIDTLEPRPARDRDATKEFSNDTAVYASPNPQVCIISLLHFEQAPEELRKGHSRIGNSSGHITIEISKKLEKYVKENVGTLYIVPPDTFENQDKLGRGWQSKSKSSVKPIDRVSVTYDDFIELGGEVVWTD